MAITSSEAEYIIETDGKTVWVNGRNGALGRFGPMGIDVHTAATDGCLDCTHHETDVNSWLRFQRSMAEHHQILVSDHFMPERLR